MTKTNDLIYLKENRKKNTKEYFKFINGKASVLIRSTKKPRILDVGCATGDFLYYLSQLYPEAELCGVDILPELIDRAKSEVPVAKFFPGDIFSGRNLPGKKFDFVFMNGVHPVVTPEESDLDDYKVWFDNLLKLTGKGGWVFVFGIFNPNEADAVIKMRVSKRGSPWLLGWNLVSKKTIGDFLKRKNLKFKFYDFQIRKDIKKHKEDPLRSWTVPLKNGSRMIMNGAGIVYTLSLLAIEK